MITEEEVHETLSEWAFAKNANRQNVLPGGQDWVWSDTVGLLRDRVGDIHLTSATKLYPEVVRLLNKYLADRLPAEVQGFKWTSLNLNCDYAARLHRDGNNFGPSAIKAFGPFTGGQLNYWPEDDRKVDQLDDLKDKDKVQFDLKNGVAFFNGNCAHSVNDFVGHRYSVVYFTVGCHDKAPQDCSSQLEQMGFHYPETDEDRYELLRPPRGYGAGRAAPDDRAACRYYPTSQLDKDKVLRAVPTPSRPTAQVVTKAEHAKEPKATKATAMKAVQVAKNAKTKAALKAKTAPEAKAAKTNAVKAKAVPNVKRTAPQGGSSKRAKKA